MPLLRRLAGVGLLVVAYAPLHRLLDVDRTGPAGAATRRAAEYAWISGVSGTVIVLALAWLCARMLPPGAGAGTAVARLGRRIAAPGRAIFAVATGCVVTGLTVLIALFVHARRPTSVDEMAQLLHAAAIAAGRLGIPLPGSASAWVVQNGIVADGVWVSIYPPAHTVLLAAGLAAGTAWLVGPVLAGVATAALTWSADELLGPVTGRLAGMLLAVSPFWLLLGAGFSSHVTAAAGLSLVLLCALRTRAAGSGWAVATGAAVGLAVAARPWTGVLCSTAILATLWHGQGQAEARARRLAATVVGGAPFAVFLLAWNRALFGSPWRLGYSAAFGPAHGLGLHADPWGNRYGAVEAVAYTSADLLQLGVRLFESPLPALALVAAALLVAPVRRGAGVFAAWAAAGIAASALYWHHGIHFGPRMLYETVPAWAALFAAAVAVLVSPGPQDGRAGPAAEAVGGPDDPVGGTPDSLAVGGATLGGPAARVGADDLAVSGPASSTAARFLRWTVLTAVVGGLALSPTAIGSAGAGPDAPDDPLPPDRPALVFVHGSWSSRIAGRLVGAGMRRDSVETALRRNDVCAVDRYARWRSDPHREGGAPALDFEPRPGTPASLRSRELSPGNAVRADPDVAHDATCARQARADRVGVLELEHLAWRFPPLGGGNVWVARDLGPGGNLPVLNAVERRPYILVDGADGPTLLDYEAGMELLWGGAAGKGGR